MVVLTDEQKTDYLLISFADGRVVAINLDCHSYQIFNIASSLVSLRKLKTRLGSSLNQNQVIGVCSQPVIFYIEGGRIEVCHLCEDKILQAEFLWAPIMYEQ